MSYVEIYNERLHDLLQPYKPNARLDPQVTWQALYKTLKHTAHLVDFATTCQECFVAFAYRYLYSWLYSMTAAR